MVSVNFRSSNRNSSPKRGKNKNVGMQTSNATAAAANAKPMCVIDVMQSPYRIIEESPKEIFDVFSDEENDARKKNVPSSNSNANVGSTNNIGKQKISKTKPTPPNLPLKSSSNNSNNNKSNNSSNNNKSSSNSSNNNKSSNSSNNNKSSSNNFNNSSSNNNSKLNS